MDMEYEAIQALLPKYLPANLQDSLIDALRQFPDNIDSSLYSLGVLNEEELLQGDVIASLPFVFLPAERRGTGHGLVLSNSCDLASENRKHFPTRVLYCPLVGFEQYREVIEADESYANVESRQSYLISARNQQVSDLFFLPATDHLPESLALFSAVISCDLANLGRNRLIENRVLSLSQYGFYLLLFKLSYHFTRPKEGLIRDATDEA